MADIIETMRAAKNHPLNQHGPHEWLEEAIMEIERLRAENERLREAAKPFADMNTALAAWYMYPSGTTAPYEADKPILKGALPDRYVYLYRYHFERIVAALEGR